MAILVTGGAGYIGSHTSVELLNAGKEIIILDNFSNSKREVLDKIKEITNKDFKFYEIDYLDTPKLRKVFEENKIDAVQLLKDLSEIKGKCEDTRMLLRAFNIKG